MTTAIQKLLKPCGVCVLAVTSSTATAQRLDDGRSANSAHKIPISVHSPSICSVEASSQLSEEMRRTILIVWDEIGFTHRHNLKAVNGKLNDPLR